MITRECAYWKTTADRGKHYDCMISLKSRKLVTRGMWLPYKTINQDSNTNSYRLLMVKEEAETGLTVIEMDNLRIPNEGKVMEVKEKSILSAETDTSGDSFMKKYELSKLKFLKVRERVHNLQYLYSKFNYIAMTSGGPEILLFDFNLVRTLKNFLDVSEPLIELVGSGDSYVRKKFLLEKLIDSIC